MGEPRATAGRSTAARYYRGARTVHLERLAQMAAGDFLYGKPMYDFDNVLADSLPQVSQVAFRTVLWRVLCGHYEVLELAEPYTPSALPQNLALATATLVSTGIRRSPTRLVTYAIENSDLAQKLAAKTRLPSSAIKPVIRALVGFCYRRFDRIVFGTHAAYENYRDLLGEKQLNRVRPVHTLVWGLPAAESEIQADQLNPELIFLGALDSRKGITTLMNVWDSVTVELPSARLTVLGKGEFRAAVEEWAATRSSVTVAIDPSREQIRTSLARSKVLFLLSQPSALWKEQIGLPIIEGLGFGLEIVASTETGISRWLADNGHATLRPDVSDEELVPVLIEKLQNGRPRMSIVASLPPHDGRLEADAWLFPRAQ